MKMDTLSIGVGYLNGHFLINIAKINSELPEFCSRLIDFYVVFFLYAKEIQLVFVDER